MTLSVRIHAEHQDAPGPVTERHKQPHVWRLVGIHVENKVVWEKRGESGQCSEEGLGREGLGGERDEEERLGRE